MHLSITNVIFLVFVLEKIYCGQSIQKTLGISGHGGGQYTFRSSTLPYEEFLVKMLLGLIAVACLSPIIFVTMMKAKPKVSEKDRLAKHAEYMRNYRAAESMKTRGYVRKPGNSPILNPEEEEYLHQRVVDDIKHQIHHPLIWLCEMVCFIFRTHYLACLQQVVDIKKSAGVEVPTPHLNWARRFLKRHKDIVLRRGTPMEKDRRVGGSVQVVSEHFDKFESAARKGGYLKQLVYNYDEIPMINKKEKPPKLLADKFSTYVNYRKDHIITSCTCAPCIAADGGHATTAMAFPGDWDLKPLKRGLHNSSDFAYYNTPHGSFTVKAFEYHVRHRLLPDFLRRREEMIQFLSECDPETIQSLFHSANFYGESMQCDNCKKQLYSTGFL
jgi:hypothetical protein